MLVRYGFRRPTPIKKAKHKSSGTPNTTKKASDPQALWKMQLNKHKADQTKERKENLIIGKNDNK